MRGGILFSKLIYESKKRQNKGFIVIASVLIISMYNIMNTYYNKAIYDMVDGFIKKEHYDVYNNFKSVIEPVEYKIKSNIFLILVTISIILILSMIVFINKKNLNNDYIVYSGGDFGQVLNFNIYNVARSFLVASILGIIGGIIISPVYNIVLYWIMGNRGRIFTFNIEGFLNTWIVIILIIVTIILVNIGVVYCRKDAENSGYLLKKKIEKIKKRPKIKWEVYWIIYLIPIIYALTFPRQNGAKSVVYIMSCGSIVIVYWLVKYGLDETFKFLKQRNFMYKKNRIIYIGSAIKDIKKITNYIITYMICGIYTINIIGQIAEFETIQGNLAVALSVAGMMVVLGSVYRLYVDFEEIEKKGLQLKILGYSEKEIIQCIASELVVVVLFIVVMPLILLAGNLIVCITTETVDIFYGVMLILEMFFSTNFIGIIFIVMCKKRIKKSLQLVLNKPKKMLENLINTI